MNATSLGFFAREQSRLEAWLILSIMRLLDPEQTRGKSNLTLRGILAIAATEPTYTWVSSLQTRVNALETRVEPLKTVRNKSIAHLDKAVTLSGTLLSIGLNLQDLGEVIQEIGSIVDDAANWVAGTIYDSNSRAKPKFDAIKDVILLVARLNATIGMDEENMKKLVISNSSPDDTAPDEMM